MEQLFNGAQAAEMETPVVEQNSKKNTEKISIMKETLKKKLETPGFAEKLRRLSNSVEVVNTLGYGKAGNIVVDHNNSTADERVLKPTSPIFGYKLKNTGEESIEYMTEVYAQDETGKYVGTRVNKTFAPGEIIDLTRQYMTMFCAIPEISFTLANGKIIFASKKKTKSTKEELEACYFQFSKNEEGFAPNVNDDEVKLSIDDDGVVKAEYVETFGYLNNPKESGSRSKGKGGKLTTQDIAASWIQSLIAEQQGSI